MKAMRVSVLLLCSMSFNVFANFGFGPCCFGSPCGIVPCDNSCAGPALRAFGQEFFSGVTKVNAQSIQLTAQKANANVQSATFYSSLGQRLVLQTASLLRALEALVSRYDGAISLATDRWRRLSDNLGSQIEQSVRANASVKQFSTHGQALNGRAQGPSSGLLSERIDNQAGLSEHDEIESALYLAALGHMQQAADASKGRDTIKLLEQRQRNLNSQLMLVSPFTQLDESTLASNFYQLESGNVEHLGRRVKAQVLADRLSRKINLTQTNMESIEQDWQALRTTPLVDSQYQQQLALATEPGLLRESALLQQQQSALLMEINHVSQQLSLIKAISQ